jgi:hypothetical protein
MIIFQTRFPYLLNRGDWVPPPAFLIVPIRTFSYNLTAWKSRDANWLLLLVHYFLSIAGGGDPIAAVKEI